MANLAVRATSDASVAWLWTIRATVLGAFVATLVLAGPRAYAVTRHRFAELERGSPKGPSVDLDRVSFVSAPEWLRGELSVWIARDLSVAFDGSVGLLDEPGAQALLARLRRVPWVAEVALQRVYPDKLRAALSLRHPEALLRVDGVVQAIDREGVCLPWPQVADAAASKLTLPELRVRRPSLGEVGSKHPDGDVQAAAAVAAEWREEIAPRVRAVPALVEVDCTNLGYRQVGGGRLSEVRVALQRADGGLAWLDYDHPPGSVLPRVPSLTKVEVLERMLATFPGLVGVIRADLRFKQRWHDWVRVADGVPAVTR